MSFTRFATATILDKELVPLSAQGSSANGFVKSAARYNFKYAAKPGYLYVRSRAISSRCNANFDAFDADELKKSYKTFIAKPVFVNHVNSDPTRARGVIIDAVLHEHKLATGAPDTWVEVLMEIDAVTYPKLARAILAGEVDRTSMGTSVGVSTCSVCGNKAQNPTEFCNHVRLMKGMRIAKARTDGRTETRVVYEKCADLKFFENSLLYEPPADATAALTGIDNHWEG